ncbi:MAG: response regulator, partial [Chloroflexota bacterium]|nr:response regulator [Chloroflexota bacterium]
LGIETDVCSQTYAVLDVARRLCPDVILMDLFLPDRFGWDILAELRADPQLRAIPVIVTSIMAVVPPSHLVDDLSLGSVHMLAKPFTRDDLSLALAALTAHEWGRAADLGGIPGTMTALKPVVAVPTAALAILLVEDNETNINTFSDYLQAHGYRVQVARNGYEAMSRLGEIAPDLLLLDIQMPGMDGLEVMRLIRKDKKWQALPIIALTALAMPGDRERCLAAGANGYLSKPISLKGLISTIAAHLK